MRKKCCTTEDQLLANLCKALGHPLRVSIMRILLEEKHCIAGELVERLPVAQATVSQHLKILKDVGLIRGEIDGPRRCYCVDQGQLSVLKQLVKTV